MNFGDTLGTCEERAYTAGMERLAIPVLLELS